MKPLDASKIFNLTYEEMQIGTGSILAMIALVVLIYKFCKDKGSDDDDKKKDKDSVDEQPEVSMYEVNDLIKVFIA